MTTYTPPAADMIFILRDLLRVHEMTDPPEYAELDESLIEAVAHEAGRFCREVIAPLNTNADKQGCTRHADASVTTPDGFREAYAQWVESGWGTLAQPAQFGGQGMPHALFTVIEEYLNSACAGFTMYPGIMAGAVKG